jgi:adenylate cyclase
MNFFEELKRRNVFRVGIAYTVVSWLLIQVADTVFPRIGLQDSAVTLVIALLAIGFIPALIFAWAFEMTPDGIKRERDVNRGESITQNTGKRLDRMIIAGLVIVIVVMAVERSLFAAKDFPEVPATTAQADRNPSSAEAGAEEASDDNPSVSDDNAQQSVAVLPFAAMSSGEDDAYFADGLTEEILNSLTSLPELLVTARTSSFHFKDKNLPIPEIARALGVDHVVEGSVRRSGDKIRITAQLIRADDGFHLWSNTYDRTLEDVFAVQEDIAENIAETLDVVLSDDKREKMKNAGIGNVEAFIAYQKGYEMTNRAHSMTNPLDLLPEANRYFDQALALVPDITRAQVERTDLYGHILYNNASGVETFDALKLENALQSLLSGLSLAARSASSDAQRAYIEADRAVFTDDWSGIPAKLDRAFQTDECFSVNWVDSIAAMFGWAEQVVAHFERLRRCDPLSSVYVMMSGHLLIWAGRSEQFIEVADNYLENVAYNSWIDDSRFLAYLASGTFRDQPSVYDDNPEDSYFAFPRVILVHAMENHIDKARQMFEQARQAGPLDEHSMLIIETALGNRQAANNYASQLDARFAGSFMLAEVVKSCFCGAPFDLEATPNFKARIEEAGFSWPPASPIRYPAKDW